MKKIFLSASLLVLIAVGYLFVQKKNAPVVQRPSVVDTQTVVDPALPEITSENVKAAKQALIEQLANDLYTETDRQLKNGEPVRYDDESIYDDIVEVDVEVELFSVEQADFGKDGAVEDTSEKTLK